MGMFANLTQIYYNNSFCNLTRYFYKQDETECFGDPIECCDNIAGKHLVYDKCINGVINYCSGFNQAEEAFGYILQIFGVLFLTLTITLIVFGFCRYVCYRDVESFDRNAERQKFLNNDA